MNLYVYGMNHRSASLQVREQVMIGHERLPAALQSILSEEGILEAVIISTCNRCELYAIADDGQRLGHWMQKQHHAAESEYEKYTYLYSGEAAVQHLLRVAVGLDAQVLGEPQILGQVKQAFARALELGAAGPELNHLFQQIFNHAKAIRQDTDLGRYAISVSYLTSLKIKQCLQGVDNPNLLLVGAGEIISDLLPYLNEWPELNLTIVNRTAEHARALAPKACILEFSDLERALKHCDLAIFAIESRTPLFTEMMAKKLIAERTSSILYCVDLALPRNVEPSVANLKEIQLYNLDDIHAIIDANQMKREEIAALAEEQIKQYSQRYQKRLENVEFNEIIRVYRRKIDDLREQELQKALQQLLEGVAAETVLLQFSHALSNKIMHQPSATLNQARFEKDSEWLNLAKDLLGLA